MDKAQSDAEEDALREQWRMGDYIGACPNCGRQRLCRCANGKSRCEKCYWVPEDNDFHPPDW